VLNQYPQTMIRVEGHTDQTGSEQYNLQLSERRANAVKNALSQKGIDPARVSAVAWRMLPGVVRQCRQPPCINGVDRPG